MNLDARIAFLLLGCLIGFILGYVVRSLRDIKQQVADVDAVVHNREHSDAGSIRASTLTNVGLLFVVAVTVWAAIASQIASNDSSKSQSRVEVVSSCNQQFLTKTIAALNARTQFTSQQGTSNVELQKAQATYLSVVIQMPAATSQQQFAALQMYFTKLTAFTMVSSKTNTAVKNNPYPTPKALRTCLSKN